MARFPDYQTGYSEFKKKIKSISLPISHASNLVGFDCQSYKSFYKNEIEICKRRSLNFAGLRNISELMWYGLKRPFFNVYPVIERKFLEMSDSIDMRELSLPFASMEIRTTNKTMLISDFGRFFLITVELGSNGDYQEFQIAKEQTINNLSKMVIPLCDEAILGRSSEPDLENSELVKLVFMAAGVCMLAKDTSIVKPVLLEKHRKENMTPSEMAKYAEKAVNRNGRIGFDVGRELDRMPASAHYRNGHFAKFYVGKNHECYPSNCELSKVAIIKWRCGSLVNKDRVPMIPTGFHDEVVRSHNEGMR